MKKLRMSRIWMFLGLLFVFTAIGGLGNKTALAATTLRVAAVEYYDENIIVFNDSNTKIYFATEADASNNRWDVMPVDKYSDFTMIDFSWLSPNMENILMIKGDVDQNPARIIISKKPVKLDISINYSNIDNMNSTDTIGALVNIMTTEGTGAKPIGFSDLEWRKGDYGQWESTDNLTVGLVEKFLIKGTTLTFRIRAVDDTVSVSQDVYSTPADPSDDTPIDLNLLREMGIDGGIRSFSGQTDIVYGTDYPNGKDGRRFSSEVKLKLTKKAPSMVYGIDGEEFTAEIKYGKEYRVTVTHDDGSIAQSDWKQVTDRSVKSIPLSTIVNSCVPAKFDASGNIIDFNGTTVAFPAMLIEVREYATSRTASSKITEISLDKQRELTLPIQSGPAPENAIADEDPNIYVEYNGNKNLILTIPKASTELPYEYCIVKKGVKFDLSQVTWSSVTKGTGIKILASKAVEGGTLYVRQKEIKSKEATKTTDAVGYKLASTYVTHTIKYPSVPKANPETFTYIKGYPTDVTITITLNEEGRVPFETEVKSIKLGTRSIEFTAAAIDTDANGVQTLRVTLKDDDVKSLTNCYNKALTITYTKGTVDKTSIRLTVKNPSPAALLTATASKGTAAGTTSINMLSNLGTGNTFYYVISNTPVSNVNTEDKLVIDGSVNAFVSNTDIPIPVVDQYLIIYEVNSSGNIIRYKCIQITAGYRQ